MVMIIIIYSSTNSFEFLYLDWASAPCFSQKISGWYSLGCFFRSKGPHGKGSSWHPPHLLPPTLPRTMWTQHNGPHPLIRGGVTKINSTILTSTEIKIPSDMETITLFPPKSTCWTKRCMVICRYTSKFSNNFCLWRFWTYLTFLQIQTGHVTTQLIKDNYSYDICKL